MYYRYYSRYLTHSHEQGRQKKNSCTQGTYVLVGGDRATNRIK